MTKKIQSKFQLKQFRSISHAISTYEDLNILLDHLTEGVILTFKIKGACIMLYDDREKQLFRVCSSGISEKYLNKGPVFFDDSHSAFTTGEPVFVENLQKDKRVQYPKAAAEENIVSMLSVPIKCREAVMGIFRLYHDKKLNFHEEDVESISVLMQQLGLVIENKGLRNFLESVKNSMGNLPLRLLKGL